jgi:hypothetical protein
VSPVDLQQPAAGDQQQALLPNGDTDDHGHGAPCSETIATALSQTNIFQFAPIDAGLYLMLIVISTIIATLFAWFTVEGMGFLPRHPDEK